MSKAHKYDLRLKGATDRAYLVQPCRGEGYRKEDWISQQQANLLDTRWERFGTVMCRIGIFEIKESFALAIGLTDQDITKEATVHELHSEN